MVDRISPTPWEAEGDEVVDAARGSVCMVLMNGCDEANARVIAAAPEMLDALKACIREFGDANPDDDWKAIKMAREAVRKAEIGQY